MISRTRVPKAQLRRELAQRYRPNAPKDRETREDELRRLRNISRTENPSTVKRNIDKRDLFKYDLERGIINVKAVGFAPYTTNEQEESTESPPVSTPCTFIDTGFEGDGCNYEQYLNLLGSYIILNNFEADTDLTIEPYIYPLSSTVDKYDYEGTFETILVVNSTESPAITSEIKPEDEFVLAPDNITVSADRELSSITLTWDNINPFDVTTRVERSLSSDSGYTTLDTVAVSANQTGTYVDLDEFILDEIYYYKLTNINAGGYDSESGNVSLFYASDIIPGDPYSINFDATSQSEISVPTTTAFNFGTGDFTFTQWINPDQTLTNWTIFEFGYYYDGIMFRPNGSGTLQVYINGSQRDISISWANYLNKWSHFVLMRKSGVMYVYADDVLLDSWPNTSSIFVSDRPFKYGSSTHTTNQRFDGQMDEMQIWSRSFTETELADNKYLIRNGTETDLQLYYPCDVGSGLTVTDATGVHDGTLGKDGVWTYGGEPLTPPASVELDSLFWLDASDASTITEVSGEITQVSDSNGGTVTLDGESGYLPELETNGINGVNAINFTYDYLTLSTPFSTVRCIIMVTTDLIGASNDGDTTDIAIPIIGNNSTGGAQYTFIPKNDTYISLDGGTTDGGNASRNGNDLISGRNPDFGTAYSTDIIYADYDVNQAMNWVCRLETSGGELRRVANMTIGEMIILDYVPNRLERQEIVAYLANKWGLMSKLPYDHLYYQPPTTVTDSNANLSSNLESYWKFDGDATDSIGTSDGTVFGATQTPSGKINQAYDFDGSNDYINVGPSNHNQFTWSAWFNLDTFTQYKRVMARWVGPDNGDTEIDLGEGGEIRFILWVSGSVQFITTSTSVNVGTWYHVVGTYDGSTMRIYLNGSLENSKSTSFTANSNDVWIGSDQRDGRYIDGKIDEVGIWSRALDATEVEFLYDSGDGLPLN